MASWQDKSDVANSTSVPPSMSDSSQWPTIYSPVKALNHEHSLEILVLHTTWTCTGDTCTPHYMDNHWRYLYSTLHGQSLEILVLLTTWTCTGDTYTPHYMDR